MLVDVRRGHITGLIFSKLARLSRNNLELLEFADIFKTCGADLISLAEAIDTSTPAGRLFFGLLASMATWEREEIASRVAASVPIRAKMGKPLGGQAPYGYRYENKVLMIDETEGPIRALLYTLYREHGRKKKVASVLNERGYRTRSGSPWSDTTVERLLRDPTAKGKKRTNYTKQTTSGGAWQLKPESEWVYQDVPALVDEALFDEVVASLDAKKLSGKRQPKTPKHLFGGYTYCACGDGGQKMYVLSGTAKYCCTACKNKIGTDTLEAIFAAELQGFVFSSEEIRQHEKAGEQELAALTQQIETHADLHKKVEGKLSALLELYEAKAIDTRGFKTRYEPLGAQLELLAKELPRLQGRRDALVQSLRSHAAVIAKAEGLSDRWSGLAHDEKRAIVETILERITVGKSDVEIIFALSPGGSLPPTTSLGTDNKKATPPHGSVAFLRSLQIILPGLSIRRKHPKEPAPRTLGERIRAARLTQGLTQKEAAQVLGVCPETVLHWEKGSTEPAPSDYPKLVAFAGEGILPEGSDLAARLVRHRLLAGLSRKAVAKTWGIDEETLAGWEAGKVVTQARHWRLLERVLA